MNVLPIKRDLALAYRLSLAVAVLMAAASAAGIALGFGGLYGDDPTLAGSPFDVATNVVLLVFGAVCFVPLAFFIRGARASGVETPRTSVGADGAESAGSKSESTPPAKQRVREGRQR